ncbi:MAG TPA: VOC family protein, partial [Nocardioidaceae bacterium]|nr:VOC family protein [Nocardioidaceae bacterium]
MTQTDLAGIERERARIRSTYLKPMVDRPASTARGLHHTALLCADVERTVRFYQDVLGFPLTEMVENRDYAGSTHFFFDIGHGNLLAFFDLPGLDLGEYAEV